MGASRNENNSLWDQSKDYDVHKLHETIPGRGIGSEFGLGRRGGYSPLQSSGSRSEHFMNASFTANGRAALKLAARDAAQTSRGRRKTVLLPAYLCHSMVQPFVELGLRIRFYPVASQLSVKASEILSRIDDSTVTVMLMHYFGFSQSEDIAEELAKRFPEVCVIDDRTHLLVSDLRGATVPSDSAISVYSPRKWGPFPDLGIVAWPRRKSPMASLDGLYDWRFLFWRLWGGIPRSLFFIWPGEALRRLSRTWLLKAEAVLDTRVLVRRASPVSRLLWRRWDWATAWHARRENYKYLLDNWPSADVKPLFTELTESACPLGFPIRATSRDSLQKHFISKGIYLPIHWVRPPQVSPDEFPDAAALADHELTIPIDQRYSQQHMDYILEAICRA